MHHHHANLALVLTLSIGITVVLLAVAVAIGLRLRRRLMTGASFDQWRATRQALSRRDRFGVWAAMSLRRPVREDRLIPAQLQLSQATQDMVERSPLSRRRWLWFAFGGLYLLLFAMNIVAALTQVQQRGLHWAGAVFFLIATVYFAAAGPWMWNRGRARLAKLHATLAERAGQTA